eukprot:m.248630 g.248630  ORF g.248630 m.248630 type:complete len:126 (+) comp40290_c0_seq44:2825-3202(+)
MVGVLLPILGYGSELWMIDKPKVSALLHRTWRRGFRRGLRVANRCSLREMYNGQFAEAEDLLRVSQMLFTWRICHSRSPVVRSFVLNRSSRSSKCPLRGLPSQCNARLMALPYSDFKGWVKTHPP